MRAKEKIEAVLSLYKTAINSYSWEHHYRDNKPLEPDFDRQMMANTKSSLYDDVCSLFLELRLPQAHRYISMWEKQYIISGWCADQDRESYNRLQAIGQTFINECKRIAQEVCEPEGEQDQRQPQGGGGTYHPNKVQQKKAQTEKQETARPKGRPKGRPVETLQDKVVGGDTGFIKKLHTLIDGKKGKDFCLYIVASIKLGKLTKPTYTQVKNEFGDIGNKSGFNRYLDERKFTQTELEGAMNQINTP